jgi:copper chaperone
MEPLTLVIDGMSCDHCVARVKRTLDAIPGVTTRQVRVGGAEVEHDPALVSAHEIAAAVDGAGYPARVDAAAAQPATGRRHG